MSIHQKQPKPEGTSPPNTYMRSGPRRGKPTRHQFRHTYQESRPYVQQNPHNDNFREQFLSDTTVKPNTYRRMPNHQRPPMQNMQSHPKGPAPRNSTPAGPCKCFNCGYDVFFLSLIVGHLVMFVIFVINKVILNRCVLKIHIGHFCNIFINIDRNSSLSIAWVGASEILQKLI